MPFKPIRYENLGGDRAKENFNFQKVSGVLADYGFTTLRLTDDYKGADFLAVLAPGKRIFRVQLKGRGRFCIAQKYENKGLWCCFPFGDGCYLFRHDWAVAKLRADDAKKKLFKTESWLSGRKERHLEVTSQNGYFGEMLSNCYYAPVRDSD